MARGEFNASEFAADLHLVATGEASPEYSNPVDFFSRTYVTEGLKDLLSRALRRISGDMNASPVVNLQTNFGGGKTHSMLARNIYDMSFDSTDRLWFMSYDHPAETITHLGSIIPSDANPINTYAQSGPLTLNSSVFHTNVLWIEGDSAPNNSVSGNNEQETTLAATGNHSVYYLGFSFSIVVVGILFLALFRKAERKLRS